MEEGVEGMLLPSRRMILLTGRHERTLKRALKVLQLVLCPTDAANQRLTGCCATRFRLHVNQKMRARLFYDPHPREHHVLVSQHGLAHHAAGSVTLLLEAKRLSGWAGGAAGGTAGGTGRHVE